MYAEHALLIILYLEALQTNMISILCIIIGSSGCPHLNSRARIVGFFWDANLSQAAQAIKPWVAESISFFLPQMLIPLENRHFQWVFPSGWIPRFFIHADLLSLFFAFSSQEEKKLFQAADDKISAMHLGRPWGTAVVFLAYHLVI